MLKTVKAHVVVVFACVLCSEPTVRARSRLLVYCRVRASCSMPDARTVVFAGSGLLF